MTLFDLSAEYRAILDMAEDGDCDPEIIATHLEDIGGQIEDKADNIAYIISQLAGDAETLKKEEERLAARRKAMESHGSRLKQYLEDCMRTANKPKFKTAFHTFSIQRNPQSVRLIEGAEIPDTYLIPQEPKVDKRAILADLKAGKKFDFAELQQTDGLRIR